VLRHVDPVCRFQYEILKETGLYSRLVSEELMIEQNIIDFVKSDAKSYCVIEWERIPQVTYSYEWSFDQMKDAALAVLRIHRWALDYGMILKDASAHNIQFIGKKAKLTDALCLELYEEGTGWAAYDQFCRHFLAPLLLMKHLDIRLQQLLRIYHDGIPLDLASKMLTRNIDFTTFKHIHWHARTIAGRTKAEAKHSNGKTAKIRKCSQISQIESLIHIVEKLDL
jgi:hypothetical protein